MHHMAAFDADGTCRLHSQVNIYNIPLTGIYICINTDIYHFSMPICKCKGLVLEWPWGHIMRAFTQHCSEEFIHIFTSTHVHTQSSDAQTQKQQFRYSGWICTSAGCWDSTWDPHIFRRGSVQASRSPDSSIMSGVEEETWQEEVLKKEKSSSSSHFPLSWYFYPVCLLLSRCILILSQPTYGIKTDSSGVQSVPLCHFVSTYILVSSAKWDIFGFQIF